MEAQEILLTIIGAAPGVIAIIWLAFREMAPKTAWQWDDFVVELVESAAQATADRMEEKAKARERKESINA